MVVLDFNHLHEFDASAHLKHVDTILSRLGCFAVSRARHGPHSTLGELVAAGTRAFIVYDSSWTSDANEFLFPPSAVDSPWLNKPLPDQLLAAAQRAWLEPRPPRPDAFFVYQGICTPDLDTIIHSTFPPRGAFRTLEQLARLVTAEVTAWFAAVPPGGIAPGICIVDFFEDPAPVLSVPAQSHFVRTIVIKNYAELRAAPARVPLLQRLISVSRRAAAHVEPTTDAAASPALTPRFVKACPSFPAAVSSPRAGSILPLSAEVALHSGWGGTVASVIRDHPGRFFGGALVGSARDVASSAEGNMVLVTASVVVAGAVSLR